MDKRDYDGPEDENSYVGRSLIFLLFVLIVVGVFYGIYNTDVFR